jgi:hypothetical protein
MRAADATYTFGEWLPDLPELGNPGLIDAKNVVSIDGSYRPFRALTENGTALSARPVGAIQVQSSSGGAYVYAGTQTRLYRQLTALGSWTDLSAATYSSSTETWGFVQYDDLVIATNYEDEPQKHTIGAATSFTLLGATGAAPRARHVGRIGQFVLLGDTFDTATGTVPHRVRWCAIDDPTDWPTPGSSTAVARQAGHQFLDAYLGAVRGIYGGDQFGIIFQERGFNRVTYVGGDVVFQFDKISDGYGLLYPRSVVPVGGVFYYISDSGLVATNGVGIDPVGRGKVDRWIENNINVGFPDRVYGSYDQERNLIYWCARTNPVAGTGEPDTVLIYSLSDRRFTYGEQACEVLFQGNDEGVSNARGFTSDYKIGRFAGISGTIGTAILTTGEYEMNPGLYTFLQGVKPLVTGTTPAVTVAVGTRNSQAEAATYSAEHTATARTGFADFRSEARFHRARVTIVGAFDRAIGVQVQTVPSGPV